MSKKISKLLSAITWGWCSGISCINIWNTHKNCVNTSSRPSGAYIFQKTRPSVVRRWLNAFSLSSHWCYSIETRSVLLTFYDGKPPVTDGILVQWDRKALIWSIFAVSLKKLLRCRCFWTLWRFVFRVCFENGDDHIKIVNWTLRNKLQWNSNRNSNIFTQENAFESVVCEMAAILSRLQCVKL